MKRFRFPLRPVAVLREHQNRRAREAFAVSVQAFAEAGQELKTARARVEALAVELTAARARSFSAAAGMHAIDAYRGACAGEVTAGQAVETARQTMEARRSEYVEAHRRLEMVHRLEEKARAAHRGETLRDEQAECDDLATRRFGRRARNAAG